MQILAKSITPLTSAEYELLTAGVSCSGTMERQWMAWRGKGYFFS